MHLVCVDGIGARGTLEFQVATRREETVAQTTPWKDDGPYRRLSIVIRIVEISNRISYRRPVRMPPFGRTAH
jgi:hypothetical protein